MEKGIIWTENVKFPGHNSTLLVDAASYNTWVQEACYVCTGEALTEAMNAKALVETGQIPIGKFNFHIKSLPTEVPVFSIFWGNQIKRTALKICQGAKPAEVSFTDTVVIPILAETDLQTGRNKIWMSLTPMEVFSLRAGIKRSQGRVLIAGLGMGWLTTRILEKKSVSHVTQIEMDSDIAKFFGDPLVARFGDKLDIVIEDVWEHLSRVDLSSYDALIFDIWPAYGRARNDQKFQKLKLTHPRVWGWGDVKQRY